MLQGRSLKRFWLKLKNTVQPTMHLTTSLFCATKCLIIILAGVFVTQTGIAVEFARDIEPLLIKRCYECHGPDQQKAKLRLDSRATALESGKSGQPAVVPAQPHASELIKRVTASDPDEMMPPKGARLTVQEVSALKQWIQEGAIWPTVDPRKHWSFIKPVRPKVPIVANKSWIRNDIDSFVLARLERESLAPQDEATRQTLARRLSLDLTGLPPSWEQVQAFVKDQSPDAYEHFVDRLLASPHYGEHMARGWLDLARYADSNGYQVDLARSIWPYREWVINAFNRNQSFDQFTIEQLAGDLLPQPTLQQQIATGFNRNTKLNDEGGGDEEEYRVKAVKDRVATVSATWLGLTLNCAECHTHKYDPITQDEYYQFFAFFNNTTDGGNYNAAPTVDVPKPDLGETEKFIQTRLNQTKQAITHADKNLVVEQRVWETLITNKGKIWQVLNLTNAFSNGGSSYTNLPDGSLLGTGLNPIYDTITVNANTDLMGITAVLLEVLPDPSLPNNGPGRWDKTGNFILDEFSLSAIPKSGPWPADTNVVLSSATADWEQPYYRAEHAVDRNTKTGWAIGPQFGQRHHLIAELKNPIQFKEGNHLSFRFDHYHGNSHCVGRFRLSVTTETDPIVRWPVPDDIRQIITTTPSLRTKEKSEKLATFYRQVSPTLRNLERQKFQIEQRLKDLPAQKYSTLVLKERSETQPRQTYVHVRGDFLSKGKEVTGGVPAALLPLATNQARNRLSLAKWLVDPDHPLTARVTVNRFWERCFGTGLVKTSEDFGRQGDAPSHPELLDWLATEFIRIGWDVKAMQKLIVMSAAYRQDAATDETRLEKDFYNRLISRGSRFRMDAEMIRDHALMVSGLLNPKLGGPSVYPVQLPNLWKEIGFLRPEIGMDEWPTSEGPDLYRRAIYTFWRRVCTYPTFATFDAPSRDVCVSRRPRTNTPLQALAGLNEPTLLEAARVFAQRVLREGGQSSEAQMEFAFHQCLGRSPTSLERRRLLTFLDQQMKSFKRDLTAAELLLDVGSIERPAGFETGKLAAWMMVANVLFNLDETLTKG